MLKKRIVISAMTLALCLPCLASAAPLSWTPSSGILTSLTRLLDLLPGLHHGAVPSARDLRKNGPGMDPTGGTTPPPPTNQSTTTDPTTTGQ